MLTEKQKIAKECGRLVLWYVPIILVGIFLGWFWAFLVLTALYISTLALALTALNMVIKERANAKH